MATRQAATKPIRYLSCRFEAIACMSILLAYGGTGVSDARAEYSVLRSFSGGPADPARSYSSGWAYAGSRLYAPGTSLASYNVDLTDRQVLHTFAGEFPVGALHTDGTSIYGGTFLGGFGDGGTVYAIDLDGSNFRFLASVGPTGGSQPVGGVTLRGSTLYGNTFSGGTPNNGTVFSVNTDGTNPHQVGSFTNQMGARPQTGLFLSGSTLYGSAPESESDLNRGTIFRVDSSDNLSIVWEAPNFSGLDQPRILNVVGDTILATTLSGGHFTVKTDGSGFQAVASLPSLVLTPFDGKLYGTTRTGGDFNQGTLFSLNPDASSYELVRSFGGPGDGADPFAGLMVIGEGLYGSTRAGGAGGAGVIFVLGEPVPEPGSLLLAGSGLMALLFLARRRFGGWQAHREGGRRGSIRGRLA